MSPRVLLDPTNERAAAAPRHTPRLVSLEGAAVGLIDISKPRGDVFLDRVAIELVAAGATVKRYRKPTFTKVAPLALRQQVAGECNAVIFALAD